LTDFQPQFGAVAHKSGYQLPLYFGRSHLISGARFVAVHTTAPFALTNVMVPDMTRQGCGRIVNIASNAAIGTARPGTTFYAATKAKVLILTRRFAMELGRRRITVNAVAPGWIVTEMARAGRSKEVFQVRVRSMRSAP
jgi:NAD(P)-dependent dehydrogenase (short-subunit alcohol dehydrogenase family)